MMDNTGFVRKIRRSLWRVLKALNPLADPLANPATVAAIHQEAMAAVADAFRELDELCAKASGAYVRPVSRRCGPTRPQPEHRAHWVVQLQTEDPDYYEWVETTELPQLWDSGKGQPVAFDRIVIGASTADVVAVPRLSGQWGDTRWSWQHKTKTEAPGEGG